MDQTKPLTSRLKRWRDDRGALAQLRGALRPQLRSRAWPLLAQLCDLNSCQAPVYETVVGLWANDPDSHSGAAGNFGASCRRLRDDHESFDVRFRQLIDCDTREELCERIVGITMAMQAKGIAVNFDTLFKDLGFYANGGIDIVRTNWAQTYWGSVNRLHLTQISISHEDAIKRLRIRDAYDWHQRVWSVFARQSDQARDHLFRVDRGESDFRLMILSQSDPVLPDWCPADHFQTKLVPESFLGHDCYRFNLRANPTKCVLGKRIPLSTDAELAAWIERKGLAGGFSVDLDSLQIAPHGREGFMKRGSGYGHHSVVDFSGVLTVTDPEVFRRTVAAGIGSAKAFGYGMLALSPICARL